MLPCRAITHDRVFAAEMDGGSSSRSPLRYSLPGSPAAAAAVQQWASGGDGSLAASPSRQARRSVQFVSRQADGDAAAGKDDMAPAQRMGRRILREPQEHPHAGLQQGGGGR